MKSFEYAAPKTLKEATALLADAWGKTEILAGGTDLVTSLKQRITQPERLVSLKNIKDLKGIEKERRGLRIGATTTLNELIGNEEVQKNFPAIVTAVSGVGSPQILRWARSAAISSATALLAFRNGFGLLARKGDTSLVREGDNRYHAIFGNDGPALFVSPSSLGPALLALEAEITATGPSGKRGRFRSRTSSGPALGK
jgi:CO/xanthine dehydrogenase FAD-binding subunit